MLILMIIAAWLYVSILVLAMCCMARTGDQHLQAETDHHPPVRNVDLVESSTREVAAWDVWGGSVPDSQNAQAA